MFNHLLLPLDGSQLAECVLPHALALATPGQTRITLARVLGAAGESNGSLPIDPFDWRFNRVEAEAYLEKTAKRLASFSIQLEENVILEGDPAQRTIEYAHQNDIDLILLSSHGRSGVSRWNVSSVVRKILQNAHVSTLLVRAYDCPPASVTSENLQRYGYRCLLVPLDGSLRAEAALPVAAGIVQTHQAQLCLAHILLRPETFQRVPPSAGDRQIIDEFLQRSHTAAQHYMEQLNSHLPTQARIEIRVNNNINSQLNQIVSENQVDLVVLSAHGHSSDTGRPFGSITSGLIEYGATALLTLQDLDPAEIQPSRAEEAAREHRGHA